MVFLFCATAFGVVLTLGGLRYSSVETEIYLLTTNLLDLQAAAALSILQLVVVTGAAARRRPRARRTPDPTVARVVGPAAAARAAATCPALALDRRCCSCWWPRRSPRWSSARCASTTPGAWPTTARCTTTGDAPGAARAGHRRAGHLAAHRRRRDLDVAAARAARGGRRHPPLALAAPSAGCAAALDGFFMLPLGVSAVTLGFGFLITLDQPPLDLRDSPLLVPIAQALVALPLVVRTLVPVLGRHRRPAAPGRRVARRRARCGPLLTVDLPVVWKPLLAAAGFAFAVLAGRVRRHVVPGPRRAPDPAGRDLPADRPPRRR